MVGEGFEPSKSVTADLQSAPFGRLGTPPYSLYFNADRRSRTFHLLITSQLLYQLSYVGDISITHSKYSLELMQQKNHFLLNFLKK